MMRRIIMFTGLCTLLCYASCAPKEEEEEKDKYTVTSPLKRDTLITREYVCQIRAIQHIELRALEQGYLQEIFVDEGKFIEKGTLMFQLLPIRYKAELQKAQAEANFAEIDYLNTKRLADSNIVSPNELAMVKAKFEKAKAEVALAQVHLGFTEIRAPFSGLMDRFQVRLGSLLDEGDLLTTMSDISTLWVYFNVPEAEYLDYKEHMKTTGNNFLDVKLRMANNEIYPETGIVKTIESDFNNMTGVIAFRATFDNPDMLLRHGETGNIIVTIPLKNKLIIPQKATFEVLDKKYVYVLDKHNSLKARKINILADLPDLYIIKDGLEESDKILLEGLRKVNENDTIQYEFQDPKKVIANLKLHAE